MMQTTIKRQKGIGLLELMLALVVIAVILMTSARYFQTTRESNRTNEAISMVTAVYTAADIWISQGLTFDSPWDPNTPSSANDPLLEKFVNTHLLPPDYTKDMRNPWGGDFKVEKEGLTSMKITMKGLPQTACTDLSEKFALKLSQKSEFALLNECQTNPSTLNISFDFSKGDNDE